jgi:hypothetical protein
MSATVFVAVVPAVWIAEQIYDLWKSFGDETTLHVPRSRTSPAGDHSISKLFSRQLKDGNASKQTSMITELLS